jgi:peptidoglycan/LPS O-acetylase OafA/YrhL
MNNRNMIKPLTSLRFLFAFMVFASHLSFLNTSESNILRWIYNSVFYEGYIGVSFFFILSGFILAYNYQDGILQNQKSKKTFYQARFARIYPLHILTLIMSIPLTYSVFIQNKSLWFSQALTNLTLTQSYIPKNNLYFSFNAPSWSISDEMFFYLVFPFLIILIPKIRDYKNILIFLIITIIPLLTLIIPENYYHQIFYINPFTRVVDFIIGIFIFNIYQTFTRKKRSINYNYLEISAILLLLVFFLFHQSIAPVARYSFYYWIPMGYLIFSFSFQKGSISKFLSRKTLIHLGEISFGFYMFHQLVLRYFSIINSKILHIENDILIVIITFTISLVVSHYSFILFETPMNKYIKNTLRNRKTTPNNV